MSITQINLKDTKDSHPEIYEVFVAEPARNGRQEGESLHDYMTRRKMDCFCPQCRTKKKGGKK